MPHSFATPPVKMRLERPAGRDKREIINNFSAEDAQSATTTTAASGGNREELLGQRPARRECRPRHEADAGSRNPIAEAILNRPVPVPKSNESAKTNRNVFQDATHCGKEIEQILNMFQKGTQQAKK